MSAPERCAKCGQRGPVDKMNWCRACRRAYQAAYRRQVKAGKPIRKYDLLLKQLAARLEGLSG